MKLRSNGLGAGAGGGAPAWDQLLVFCRLRLMAEITRRCTLSGRDIPGGYKSCMPDYVREVSKMDYAAARPVKPAVPTAREISLRDETVGWIAHMEDVDRVILWGYAVGQSSRAIEGHLLAYLQRRLTYRAIQDRFNRLLEELARYWQALGYAVDGASLIAANAAIARQQRPQQSTPRHKGLTYWVGDAGAREAGENRTIMVEMPNSQYRKRAVQKSASQTSQIRA
jgi:hypothetical protein